MAKTDKDHISGQLRALVALHGRAVEGLLTSIEHDPAIREDLWSEVFTIAYCRIEQLAVLTPQQARGWLLRTTRNVTANATRRTVTRRKLHTRLTQTPIYREPSAEDSYFRNSSTEEVQAAWVQLSVTHQQVLELDALGHDGPSIADALGITALAARSRLMRARQAFITAYDRSETASP